MDWAHATGRAACFLPAATAGSPARAACVQKRRELGIKDNLVRFSCGIEDVEDIWADMEQALHAVFKH